VCLDRNHDETHCPLILKIFNKKFHIQKLSFYQENFNKRLPFSSRKKSKTRFVISKKSLIMNIHEEDSINSDVEIDERFFSSSLDNLIAIDLDKINLKRKENYFPQNHYEKIIYEYNQMISNKRKEKVNPSKCLFFSSNFSFDIPSNYSIGFGHNERKNNEGIQN